MATKRNKVQVLKKLICFNELSLKTTSRLRTIEVKFKSQINTPTRKSTKTSDIEIRLLISPLTRLLTFPEMVRDPV